MKNILFKTFLLFIFVGLLKFSYAQTEVLTATTDDTKTDKKKLKKEDVFISELFSDFWQETPTGLKPNNINRGYNAYFMLDNPISTSNFSLAIGLGISFHNLYSNSIFKREMDSLGQFTGNTEFYEILDNYNYSKNKLALMYIDVPVELRFRTKNIINNFKFAIGFKAGYNTKSHTKYNGDILDGTIGHIKYKEYDIKNIEKLRYGVTARIGYGKYNISAYYALTPLIKKGTSSADEMFPISIGLAFTPF